VFVCVCVCVCVSLSVTIRSNNPLHLQSLEEVRKRNNGKILNATNRLHFITYARNVSRLYTSQLYIPHPIISVNGDHVNWLSL
jgi:hypothetical protein